MVVWLARLAIVSGTLLLVLLGLSLLYGWHVVITSGLAIVCVLDGLAVLATGELARCEGDDYEESRIV